MKEPEVIINQVMSQEEREIASAASSGINKVNPAPNPGGEVGGLDYKNFIVRNSGSRLVSRFITHDDSDLLVRRF